MNLFFDFDDLSKDLDLFFFDNEKGISIASKYINNLLESENSFKIDLPIQAFNKDITKIINDVLEFYFNEVIDEGNTNIKVINDKIRRSSYPPSIKRSLYTFFINPTDIFMELIKDIKIINKQVKALYRLKENKEKQYLSVITEKISNINLNNDLTEVYCSYSLVYKDKIFKYLVKSRVIMIVGINSNEYDSKPKDIELHCFGNIISDKSRIKVLEYLKNHPLSDISTINKFVKIKNSNMVYHINLMLQYHVLKKHTNGKEVYYEINKQHWNNIVNLMESYRNP